MLFANKILNWKKIGLFILFCLLLACPGQATAAEPNPPMEIYTDYYVMGRVMRIFWLLVTNGRLLMQQP